MGGRSVAALFLLLSLPTAFWAREKKSKPESLDAYIRRLVQEPLSPTPRTAGSLWEDQGRFASLASDYKAMRVGDLVTIVVVHDLTAANSGNVAADRSFKANSGINGLAGNPSTADVQTLLSLSSGETLSGKAQSTSASSLRTSLSGRVAAVLPSGALVVEAERQVTMNNERQTITLRGLARPGDIGPDNAIASNAIANLELELKGKGVISDGTRRPNAVTRVLLRILGF